MEDNFENWLSGRGEDVSADEGRLPQGTVIGEFRVTAFLGRGGFADVYRATGAGHDGVAIKILHRLDDKSRARFVRESEILAQVRHPNVPRLLCFGSYGDRPYMVTELLRGCELPGEDRKIAVFLRQIISAVEELHRQGYVHRDIKPSNILAREDGTPVLIDFGLASPISAVKREKDGLSVEEGRNVAVGTVGYSAPEQFSGLAAGREADVHAIGVLINECYQGRLPKCWRRIYLAATTSNPKSRYQTVAELRHAVNTRHVWKVLSVILGVVLAIALAFLCVEGVRRYSIEKRTPHQFQERDL